MLRVLVAARPARPPCRPSRKRWLDPAAEARLRALGGADRVAEWVAVDARRAPHTVVLWTHDRVRCIGKASERIAEADARP